MSIKTATIASAYRAAIDIRDRYQEIQAQDMEQGETWSDTEAQRDFIAMIGDCDLVTTRATIARSVIAYAPKTRAGRIHAGTVLTVMLEAFAANYPDAADGRIDSLSNVQAALSW